MSGLLLGIDLGTTATKLVLVDPAAVVRAEVARASDLVSGGPGVAEADTARWWANVCGAVPDLLERGVVASQITAVSTTGMVPAVVPLDADDRPLRSAILQNDSRATAEIEELADRLRGVDLVARTGSALTQQSVAPTALWLARHEPDVWERTRSLAGSYDWLLRALGARPHLERNWALESGLFGLNGEPVDEVLAASGLDPALLPPIVDPGSIVGEVSAVACAQTGIPAGTPLVVGGADHVMSAYAAGLSAPGDTLVKLGGAGDILVVADRAVADARLYLDAHPRPGLWLPNGCMATSGSLLRWFQTLIGGAPLRDLDAQAETRAASEVLCLPYFLGEKSPLHDPDLRGAFVGLHLAHDRVDLYRSVLEAIAFGFRHHLDVLAELGLATGTFRVTNGGTRSTLWKQIHADVLDRPLTPVLDHPGGSLGAALAAGVGIGAIEGWGDVAGHVHLGQPVVPGAEAARAYAETYALWRELGGALTPIAHSLARKARA